MSKKGIEVNKNDWTLAELADSEMRYRRLFEAANNGILLINADTQKITDANPFIIELLGGSREEILGKELWEIGLFTNAENCRKAFANLAETQILTRQELSLETKSGKTVEIEFEGNIYTEGVQRVLQCNVRDIGNRKNAEYLLDQTAQNAAKLAQIAGKAARLGGWTIHLPERTLVWSDENCAIHEVPAGYKPTLEEGINYFPPEYREQVKNYVNACAQDGTPYDFELPKYTAKGRLIWVRSIGEPMRDENGKIIGIQGAFQDITARKKIAEEREKLIEDLQNALAEVKTLQEFLPICSYCKKVRDDENYWSQIESYISAHTHTKFSHSVCPDCYEVEVTPLLEEIKRKFS